MTLIPDVILVPYGVDTWSVQAIGINRFSDAAVGLDVPFPCAAINKINKRPLRLNSEAFSAALNFNPPQGLTPLAAVRDHLKSFCRMWDKLSLRFLDGYFEHLAKMLEVHEAAILTKLAPFAGLYAVEDWAFSAPKPLPRAHLYAPRKRGVSWHADAFVQVDFAFWLGESMVAVLSQPGILTPGRARERLARLEQAGVAAVHFTAEDLVKSAAVLFHRIIGDFDAMLDGAGAVPIGPFRPHILDG